MRYLVAPPESTFDSFDSVVGRAIAAGAPAPEWIVVAHDRRWQAEVARRPRSERSRAVVACSDVAALTAAHRLGMGGALRIPPSTVAAEAALTAAAAASEAVDDGVDAEDWLAGFDRAVIVVPRNPLFWRQQLGTPLLKVILAEVANRLGEPLALTPGPCLVLRQRERDEVVTACENAVAGLAFGPMQGLFVEAVPVSDSGLGASSSAARSYAAAGAAVGEAPRRPVCSLPDGRCLGWWTASTGSSASSDERWLAVPAVATAVGYQWRLTGAPGEDLVDDVCSLQQVRSAAAKVVRIPGWLSVNLRPGSPAALVVEELAALAAEGGGRLWVPNVEDVGLDFLLRLKTPLWVDGPAVPETSR